MSMKLPSQAISFLEFNNFKHINDSNKFAVKDCLNEYIKDKFQLFYSSKKNNFDIFHNNKKYESFMSAHDVERAIINNEKSIKDTITKNKQKYDLRYYYLEIKCKLDSGFKDSEPIIINFDNKKAKRDNFDEYISESIYLFKQQINKFKRNMI